MSKLKKILINTGILVCLLVMAFCGYKIYDFYADMNKSQKKVKEIQKIVKDTGTEENTRWVPTKDTFNELHSKNSDYVGYLLWDSDLISEPILQGVTNQTYLRANFDGSYDVWGSIFLESGVPLDADNLMIYGHSLAGAKYDTNKFSQLQNMTNQDFYEQNKSFKIYWENSIDSYEIISADCFDTDADEWDYTQSSFINEADKQEWINQTLAHTAITSNLSATTDDKFVTFQTCSDDYSANRYIVVAKRTASESYQ